MWVLSSCFISQRLQKIYKAQVFILQRQSHIAIVFYIPLWIKEKIMQHIINCARIALINILLKIVIQKSVAACAEKNITQNSTKTRPLLHRLLLRLQQQKLSICIHLCLQVILQLKSRQRFYRPCHNSRTWWSYQQRKSFSKFLGRRFVYFWASCTSISFAQEKGRSTLLWPWWWTYLSGAWKSLCKAYSAWISIWFFSAYFASNSPSETVASEDWAHLRELQLADPAFDTPEPIDAILSAQVLLALLLTGIKKAYLINHLRLKQSMVGSLLMLIPLQ